jgi:hypothetical protein
VKLMAVLCILAWRVFWMTMIQRAAPQATPALVLTAAETSVLDRLVLDGRRPLTGYLARNRDPPPGNTVIWRGLLRLTDITLGASLTADRPKCG